MTMQLAQIQARFHALCTGTAKGDARRLLCGSERLNANERLTIYARMYHDRLQDVLAEDFGYLHAVLGDDGFAELVAAYLRARPPRHHSLRYLGEELPVFLRKSRRWPRWLADLALVEWTQADLFDAVDEPQLTLAHLRALSPEALAMLPIRLTSGTRLVKLHWGLDTIWDALGGTACEVPQRRRQALLVWRTDFEVVWRVVDATEAMGLGLASSGTTLADLCVALASRVGSRRAGGVSGQLLAQWLDAGLLVLPSS